ncbi:MAG: rod shape-determining protein MreC [Chlorobiaceae bacterium]|nr:rod shape-determining protein MreC [Chlorobiaceae bacterium]NTV15941.1 rod shape-determining protein MreC [Chlorobiaceae bacterium]
MSKLFTLFFKYNNWLLFLLYCSIAFLFMRLQDHEMLAKLRTGGIEFTSVINEKLMSFSSLFTLKNENDRLMQVNTDLLSRVLSLETAAVDERNRRKILADTTVNASGFIMARIVDRKFSDRENILVIDAGWKKGIQKNMTVLVPEGLVGRVTSVSEHYARVMPVIHTDFRVSVVSDSTSNMGVLTWSEGRESIAQVEHIPISSHLKLNERIVTSDFSTFSIRGIPVGRVIRIKPDNLFYSVDVRLAVDFSSLNQVLIAPLKIEPEKIEISSDTTNN